MCTIFLLCCDCQHLAPQRCSSFQESLCYCSPAIVSQKSPGTRSVAPFLQPALPRALLLAPMRQSFPEEWKAELDMSILEGNSLFRECFMLHRTSKTVFAMDSLVEMTKEHMPHPLLQAGSMMAGTFGRVSVCVPNMWTMVTAIEPLELFFGPGSTVISFVKSS